VAYVENTVHTVIADDRRDLAFVLPLQLDESWASLLMLTGNCLVGNITAAVAHRCHAASLEDLLERTQTVDADDVRTKTPNESVGRTTDPPI
jgi:hypothetical protein